MAEGSHSTPPLPPWLRGGRGVASGPFVSGGAGSGDGGGGGSRGEVLRRLAGPALFLAGLAAGWLLHAPKPPPLTPPPPVAEAPTCPPQAPCGDPGPAHARIAPHPRAKA